MSTNETAPASAGSAENALRQELTGPLPIVNWQIGTSVTPTCDIGMSLCGTCKHWDHARASEQRGNHRIAKCLWPQSIKLPEWCGGFRGHQWTDEARTTERGCDAWEKLHDRR